MSSAPTLQVSVEFGGGTELLTATPKQKKHTLSLPFLITNSDSLTTKDDQENITTPSGTSSDGTVAASHRCNMKDLVEKVCKDLIVERHEMLVEPDGSIRPGILVLINDADWELEGEMDYELNDGDQLCFISTLHGG